MSDASTTPLTIVVLVKHVPDVQFDRHIDQESLRLDRSESVLSELDEYAVEAALALVEDNGGFAAGHQVIAATMGAGSSVNSVKKALQMGASSGLHLNDAALAGSDAVATSKALAALVRHVPNVDLVVTGMASTDAETSVVPAQLAELLGFAQLTHAASVAFDASARELTVDREHLNQRVTLKAGLPAVLSVTDQANDPRYPNFKGIMAAKKKSIEEVDLAGIGLAAQEVGAEGSTTSVLAAEQRPARPAGTIIHDSGDAGIALVDFLAAQKLI
ncbi:electron transfer flavoprotein subunit beta/FixA family protein [Glutamicibacter soli]|uniref:Electron transfer flavoprotein subunit beta n=1 Tax=Glutamicibacter soli TaxID=453836 RepID=A0A365YQN2_9MICC|nr:MULTISPECIES: electron transfer flavoprotein subunit beta/FixA family protein [Micrococcaceae]NAZ14527.1 electron transfer flavoprotein subunit beta [Glutamicibacter soli]RBM04254.1 electron transfer flavoprotein subunit beta [Glutamicibacter soli]